ncbi:MAG: response regulator [Candidatus Rokubacteria bacterium]|nr:response regulator [Candidatus Rokubacteria bacterium]
MATRVLVLDDQQYLRDIIAAIVEDAGYPALAVGTPDEALQQMHELHPELLILDLSLPGISGVDFLAQLRAQPLWQTMPVIVVSGDPGKLGAVKDRPHVVALTKPFDVTVLVSAIESALGPPALTIR